MKKQLAILLCALVAIVGLAACSAESKLQIAVKAANATMPEDLGDGMVMESVKLEGDFAVYTVSLEESEISIKDMQEARYEMKQAMLQTIKYDSDSDMRAFIDALKEANKGVKFKYVGKDTGETFVISILPSEL